MADRGRLLEVTQLFLRLGATSFGGPAAYIAIMEDEVVTRRKWLERRDFLDLLGATHLLPGPNATEMAIHLGYRRAGVPGLVAAGVAFILPAALITGVVAALYVRAGRLPAVDGILHGVKPVVLMVVLQALIRFGRTTLKTRSAWALGLACAVASALGVHELVVLGAAGLAAAAWRRAAPGAALASLVPFSAVLGGMTAAGAEPGALDKVFLVFLKIGAVLFGSGYVLLAFLRSDVVVRYGWLTEGQLLDAIAVGQVTPGPVFSAATFVGYLVAGPGGAAAATVGIFLPSFLFVAASGPIVARIRRSPAAGALLDGVNVASLALMAVVTAQLARGAVTDVPSAVLALSAFLLLRHGLSSSWVVLGGALAGGLLALSA